MKNTCNTCQFFEKKACIEWVKKHAKVYTGECWVPKNVLGIHDEQPLSQINENNQSS